MKRKNAALFRILLASIFRCFKKSILQFLAIIAIGAIAITLFVGLLANADVFETQVKSVYKQGNLASMWVTTTLNDTDDFEEIKRIVGDRGEVEGRFYFPGTANARNVYLSITDKKPTLSKPFDITKELENQPEDEFLYVDKDLETKTPVSNNSFFLGGKITFAFDISSYHFSENMIEALNLYVKEGGKNIFDAEKVEIQSTITGFMSHPENITKASYSTGIVVASDKVVRKAILQLLEENYKEEYVETIYSLFALAFHFNSLDHEYISNPNQYLILTKENVDLSLLKKDLEAYFEEKVNNNLLMVTPREKMPFFITLHNDVTQARQFTFVFPMVFFLVAILVILTTLSQLVLKDRTQIGTMKAIGVSSRMIHLSYFSLTGFLIFVGTLIGEIIGPLLIPNILGKKYLLIYSLPTPQYQFPILAGILVFIIFLSISLLVTYLVCRKEIKLKPSESMRPPVSTIKANFISHRTNTKTRFFALKMAMRNILMNKMKSFMVVLGVLGCTALLVCGFGIENTINYGIDHDMACFHSEDITLTLNTNKTEASLKQEMLSLDGVEHIEVSSQMVTSLYVKGGPKIESRLYLVPEESQYIKVNFSKEEVALSKQTATQLGVGVGDTIRFSYNSDNYQIKVGTIYDCFFYNGMMIHLNNELCSNIKFQFSTVLVKVKENHDIDKTIKELENRFSYISDAKTQADWRKSIADIMSGVLVMTNAVKIFAILLGIVVLYNLSLMNFKERNRDIATLKVLGFSSRETLHSLLIESLSLTLLGVLFGSALGYPFMLAVMMTNIVDLVNYMYMIYPLTYLFSFLLTFGVNILINLLLSLKIKKVKMVESLKSVE